MVELNDGIKDTFGTRILSISRAEWTTNCRRLGAVTSGIRGDGFGNRVHVGED